MADMANKFLGGAIALLIGTALIEPVANFVDSARNATGVTSTQSDVIGLILTIFVLAMAYAAYKYLVEE